MSNTKRRLTRHLEAVARSDKGAPSKNRHARAMAFFESTISPKAQSRRRKKRKAARKARKRNRK